MTQTTDPAPAAPLWVDGQDTASRTCDWLTLTVSRLERR